MNTILTLLFSASFFEKVSPNSPTIVSILVQSSFLKFSNAIFADSLHPSKVVILLLEFAFDKYKVLIPKDVPSSKISVGLKCFTIL